MLINPRQLFQVPVQPFTPKVGSLLGQSPTVPRSGAWQTDRLQMPSVATAPAPDAEPDYAEALPANLIREGLVTKLMFQLKAPLQIFRPQDPDQIINTGHKDAKGNPVRLTREAAAGYDKILAITKQRGITVRTVSTYRSVEQQRYLWEQALKKYGSPAAARKWVAPPGKSRHNSGQAIDLYMYRNGKKIPQSEFDQIVAQAGMYRPMSWETWHIEPVSTKKARGQA
jgi:hypothetical protein